MTGTAKSCVLFAVLAVAVLKVRLKRGVQVNSHALQPDKIVS